MAAGARRGTAELLKNAVVHNATSRHSATVIFLHGLGDTGNGWAAILNEIRQPHVKLICPTAPIMPVSINGGFRMPSWFDIYGLDKGGKQDEAGVIAARDTVHELLEYEHQTTGISSNRIVLGGFSQGGSLAMFSALTYGNSLGGILSLSSWLPLQDVLLQKMTPENKQIPFLQCHGDSDPMVAVKWGDLTSQFIQTFNTTNYRYKKYAGLGHSSAPEEMADVQTWLNETLPPSGGSL